MARRRPGTNPGLIGRVRWGNLGRLAALGAAGLLFALVPRGGPPPGPPPGGEPARAPRGCQAADPVDPRDPAALGIKRKVPRKSAVRRRGVARAFVGMATGATDQRESVDSPTSRAARGAGGQSADASGRPAASPAPARADSSSTASLIARSRALRRRPRPSKATDPPERPEPSDPAPPRVPLTGSHRRQARALALDVRQLVVDPVARVARGHDLLQALGAPPALVRPSSAHGGSRRPAPGCRTG